MRTETYLKTYIDELFKRDVEYVPLKKDDFMLFFETGNRLVYERKYFAGRKALTVLALRFLLGNDVASLDKLFSVIEKILEEPVWCLPAHCGKEAWDTGRDDIDLFAAETAGSIAEILYLCREKLSTQALEVAGTENDRVFCALKAYEKRLYISKIDGLSAAFFERFRFHVYDKWLSREQGFEKGNGNWTAVCSGNIGLAVYYLFKLGFLSNLDLTGEYDRILKAMMHYLEGFEPDGCCSEGVLYYNYGIVYFLAFVEIVQKTDTIVERLEEVKAKFNNLRIAKFLNSVYLGGKSFVAFSDASGNPDINIGLFSFLSSLDEKVYLPEEFCLRDFKTKQYELPPAGTPGVEILGGDECGRFAIALREYTWVRDHGSCLKTGKCDEKYQSLYIYPNTGWYISYIPTGEDFAIKGGHNDEPHNHNDVGSFVYSCNGSPILADPGAGEYTSDYFGQKRYSYFTTRSLGHNVPLVDGKEQVPGNNGRAEFLAEGSEITMDLSPAYGFKSGTVKRRVRDELPKVSVTDESVFPITENLITLVEPVIEGNTVIICLEDSEYAKFPESNKTPEFDKTPECDIAPECAPTPKAAQTNKKPRVFRIEFENACDIAYEKVVYQDHGGRDAVCYRITAHQMNMSCPVSFNIASMKK